MRPSVAHLVHGGIQGERKNVYEEILFVVGDAALGGRHGLLEAEGKSAERKRPGIIGYSKRELRPERQRERTSRSIVGDFE